MPNSLLTPSHKLKQCTNLILHDKNYTSFAVSSLIHKIARGGGAYSRAEGVYFRFWPIGGAFIRSGCLVEGAGGGINSTVHGSPGDLDARIYIYCCIGKAVLFTCLK